MNSIKRSLGGMAMSIAEVIIGILLLVNPVGFTTGIIVTAGIVMMVLGMVSIVRYFFTKPEEASMSLLLAKGLVALLGGAFCAFYSRWFIVTFPVLTLIYGVMNLISGIMKLQWTIDIIRLKRKRWFFAAIGAVVSILCGVIIISSPFSTTTVLWMFAGIGLIVEAVFDMIGALFGNREKKTETANGEESVMNETVEEGTSPEVNS